MFIGIKCWLVSLRNSQSETKGICSMDLTVAHRTHGLDALGWRTLGTVLFYGVLCCGCLFIDLPEEIHRSVTLTEVTYKCVSHEQCRTDSPHLYRQEFSSTVHNNICCHEQTVTHVMETLTVRQQSVTHHKKSSWQNGTALGMSALSIKFDLGAAMDDTAARGRLSGFRLVTVSQ